MNVLIEAARTRIRPASPEHATAARRRLDSLTKPPGSLGRLEELAVQFVALRGEGWSLPLQKSAFVFAADHGVVAEGVSAYPAQVTRQMVLNFLRGGAAINVLARAVGAAVTVVDVGVDGDLSDAPDLVQRKVRRGSRNLLREPAMTDAELTSALENGLALGRAAAASGVDLLAVGEMGIGNTTAASALTAALTGRSPEETTGRGTGVDDKAWRHKVEVVTAALARHDCAGRPLEAMLCVGGLELAAMAGAMLGAAEGGTLIVLDGFISTAAGACAAALAPELLPHLVAGHQSAEPGHRILLRHLGIAPVLELGMRLGEGTGAVLAMPVIESALRVYREMATFADAGVSGPSASGNVR